MGLSTPLSFIDIRAEFGATNRPNNARGMYNRIFGNPAGESMRDFIGTGRPEVSSISATTGQNSIDITFSLTTNSLTGYVRVEYSTDLNDMGTGSSSKTSATSYNTGGSKTLTVSSLSPNTLYYYRLQWYNAFNDQDADDYSQSTVGNVTTQAATLDAPSIRNTISYSALNGYDIEWDTTGPEPTGFSIEYRVNGGSWSGVNNITNKVNWGSGTDPKSADIVTAQLPNPFDFFEFRMRATRSGYTTSAYSNIRGYQH